MRSRKAADRIKAEISLAKVLADYGYRVEAQGDREQQFSCDLHGDGSDRKPSARLYESQFFCFACGVSRDAIALVMEKEGLEFWKAVRVLEKRYGLDPLPWEPSESPESLADEVGSRFKREESPEVVLERVARFIDSLCRERSITPQKCAGFWEAYDRVNSFAVQGGDPTQTIQMAYRILDRCKQCLGVE